MTAISESSACVGREEVCGKFGGKQPTPVKPVDESFVEVVMINPTPFTGEYRLGNAGVPMR